MQTFHPCIYNTSAYPLETIETFPFLGITISLWRKRHIALYAHPTDPDRLLSVGTSRNKRQIIIADERRADWTTALDYIAHGHIYVSQ